MKSKHRKWKHIFGKESYIKINSKYNSERDNAIEIKNIYNIVNKQYMKRLENRELDIMLERIYLNKKLDEYTGDTYKFWFKLLFIVMTVYISIAFNQMIAIEHIKIEIAFTGFIIIFIVSLFCFRRSIRKEINEHIYYKICLEALDRLEKENKNSEIVN